MLPLKLNRFSIIFCILLLCVLHFSLFDSRVPITHDGENHLARFAAYIQAFSDKHIPPRWAGNLNYQYGIPVFNFFYPLPGYLASIIYFTTQMPLQRILNLLFMCSNIFSFISFYLWIYTLRKNGKIAILTAFLYALAPYQLLNIYIRGDIGESIAMSLIPLVFYSIEQYKLNKNIVFLSLLSIIIGMVITAHHGIALMLIPLCVLYGLFRFKILKEILAYGLAVLLGFGVSAFFWLPALLEQKYTMATMMIGNMYKNHFNTVQGIVFSMWGTSANIQDKNGLAPQIGVIISLLFLFIFVTFIIKFKTKKNKLLSILFLTFFIIGAFISIQLSDSVWSQLSILKKYQFPWRFTALITISSICFIALNIKQYRGRIYIPLLLLIIVQSFFHTHVFSWTTKTDMYYFNFLGTTFYHEEASTIWSTGSAHSLPNKPIEIIAGNGTIYNYTRNNNKQTFVITGTTDTQIRANTLFYPGWKAYDDSKEIPIEFQDPNNRGVITFILPKGTHKVTIMFLETRLRKAANYISILSLLFIILLTGLNLRKKIYA